MEQQICAWSNTAPFALSMNKNPQIISKMKPRIRIIHVFAPEIIEVDAANFREEVQRLTGKPADDRDTCMITKKRSRVSRNILLEPNITSANKKAGVAGMRAGFDVGFIEKIKGEEEIWGEAYSGGGFLGGFAETEYGFMREIHKFPYMEGTTQMDAYGPGSNPKI